MRHLLLLSLTTLAVFSPSSHAARLGTQATFPDSNNDQLSQHQQNPPLFPLLTWLRDGAVELIFGRPPGKTDGSATRLHDSFLTKYADDVVLRFNLTTLEEEAALSNAASRLFLDIWAFTDDYVDIRLRKKTIASFIGLLPTSLRSSYSTLIPDLAALIRDTYPSRSASQHHLHRLQDGAASLRTPPGEGDNLFFQDYQSLPVITQWMRLQAVMFPSIARMTSIGLSYEGRDIPALRVGVADRAIASSQRKTVVVTGGMHAREWISTSTVNYLAWSFITSYGKEPMITKLLEHFDLVFIPVVNPDGVEYTWQVDRLWRKSRQETNMRFCRGLDLDHAFGYEWGDENFQTDPCSESYGGDKPFQAVEALQLAKWARNESQHDVDFVGLIDLHSYSQQVLFPFSYSCSVDPPNIENLQELAVGLAKAIRLSNGEMYSVNSACEGAIASTGSKRPRVLPRIESGGGSAIDWFYHELHARYSYQIKLRDTGSYGFLLPKENIIPTGEEIFSAMKYFGDYLLGNNGIEKSKGEDSGASTEEVEPVEDLRRARRKR